MLEFLENIDMTFIWLALLIVFVIAEALTVTLVSIWFSIGSLVAMIAAVFGADPLIQIILFLSTSIVTLLLTRPLVKRFILPKRIPTNTDRIIGAYAVVSETINNLSEKGSVFVDGKEWTARSFEGNIIEKGQKVTIEKIEGVKVFVKENNN